METQNRLDTLSLLVHADSMVKTLVVGAGLSGLMITLRLRHSRDVALVDKATGVGGRLATRRTDNAKFDHGAQFYRLKAPLRDLHERWLERQLVKLWFIENQEQHFCAVGGMTTLAKDLAQDANVIVNEKVVGLERKDQKWIATFESTRIDKVDEVIFTCPTPQTLEIFEASSLAHTARLSEVIYSKSLVLMIESSPTPFRFRALGYVEPQNSSIFSVADQNEKGISNLNAITVTLTAKTSGLLFDSPNENIIRHAIEELQKIDPDFKPGKTQLKKWKYGQVEKSFGELFAQVADGIYLAGDGFGGASLNGAARSADALSKHLLQKKATPQSVGIFTKGQK